jgi:hypothetical protein
MVKFTIRTSARVRVYPADAFLRVDGFLPSAPTVKNAFVRTRQCGCGSPWAQVGTDPRPRVRADAHWTLVAQTRLSVFGDAGLEGAD